MITCVAVMMSLNFSLSVLTPSSSVLFYNNPFFHYYNRSITIVGTRVITYNLVTRSTLYLIQIKQKNKKKTKLNFHLLETLSIFKQQIK